MKNSLLNLPGAIVIAAVIIGGAIMWDKPISVSKNQNNFNQQDTGFTPISKDEFIRGNPDAPIKIVEYSDTECPFCKRFHMTTMKDIVEQYIKTGKIAWVYRHFPLNKPNADGFILHKNAGKEAEAIECAGSLGGGEKFWAYIDRIYEITPSVTNETPEGLDQAELPKIAEYIGLDKDKFIGCLNSGKFSAKVEADYISGVNAGIQGTPYSILITKTGKSVNINGAYPFATLKTALDALLAESEK